MPLTSILQRYDPLNQFLMWTSSTWLRIAYVHVTSSLPGADMMNC